MPTRLSKPSGRLGAAPLVNGGISRAACVRARRSGIALPPLLKGLNLTVRDIHDRHKRLPARDQVRLLNLLAEATGDELLGLHVAQGMELREMGLLFYVMASSNTLFEALRRGVRYSTLLNEGVAQHCAVGRRIQISLRYVGVSRHLDRHQAECWMALIARVVRQLCGRGVNAQRVRFVHARAHRPRELAAHFGGEVEFNAAADQISFARSVGSAAVVSADPFLNEMLVRYCEEALAYRRQARASMRSQVENCIVPLLPHAQINVREVARLLGFSPRTLARKLAAENVSFSSLLDELRLDLANRYLREPGAAISQIAWLLGYQQVSAFSRAYRRWTGKSPRAMRAGASRRGA